MEKIIHYCWFGPNKLGKLEKKCLKSWEKYFPDYKIMKWSEENVNLDECEFIKEAYANKKWAYVADYTRCKALYEYGGIYFDTDMEVIKNMESLLDKGLVLGLEHSTAPNAAIVIVPDKHNKYMKKMLDGYRNMNFNPTGNLFDIAIPRILCNLLEPYGLKRGYSKLQILNKDVYVYPREYFYPLDYELKTPLFTENTYTIHHYTASWVGWKEKTTLWMRRHHLGWLVKYFWSINNVVKRIKGKKD